ncbi:MAG: hypothetical protein K2X38_25485 [Gemmataceae bacterium]|nr:hypothetical protein [Gemmataceae bacterium]
MIDALLFAVRDGLRGAGFGYGVEQCEIMDDGHPPPRAGNLFVAVHEGPSSNRSTRNLDERFAFSMTLTMRVTGIPIDRIGDQGLASKLARTAGKGQPSFNARLEQLRAWGHMNWTVMAAANTNIAAWTPSGTVYGFVEPAMYAGAEKPVLVGGEWLSAAPEAVDVALKAELRFDGARRMQPITAAQASVT